MGSLSRSSDHPKLIATPSTATTAMMLKINRASHLIKKSSPPALATKPVTTPPPPPPPPAPHHRQPVIIYTHSPKVIHTTPQDFMALVQKLTGYNGGSDDSNNNNKTKLPPPSHPLQPPVVPPPPPPSAPLLPLPVIPPPHPADKLYSDDFETKNYVMAFMNSNNNNNSSSVGMGLFDMDDNPSSIITEDHQEYMNNLKSCSNGGREGGSLPLNNNKYSFLPPVFDQPLAGSMINSLPSCFAPGYGDFCCTSSNNNLNSNNNNIGLASAAMINNNNDHQAISAYYNNTASSEARRENNGTGYCFYNDGAVHVSATSPPSLQEDMNHLTSHFS